MSFNIFYSKDAIAYVVLQDKEQWHKHTWYYKEYKWINNNVKLNNDEKILVNVSGQTTFYLKKKYINSDHASGYLSKLDIYKNHIIYMSELKKHNIMYIFIDITASLNKQIYMLNYLKDLGYLTIHKEFDTYISSSRLFNKGINHKTILYKVEQNIYYNQ